MDGRENLRMAVEGMAPSSVTEVEGGLETALGIVIWVNVSSFVILLYIRRKDAK